MDWSLKKFESLFFRKKCYNILNWFRRAVALMISSLKYDEMLKSYEPSYQTVWKAYETQTCQSQMPKALKGCIKGWFHGLVSLITKKGRSGDSRLISSSWPALQSDWFVCAETNWIVCKVINTVLHNRGSSRFQRLSKSEQEGSGTKYFRESSSIWNQLFTLDLLFTVVSSEANQRDST